MQRLTNSMGHHRIDKTRQIERIAKVSGHTTTFGQSTSDDGDTGRRKGVLEKENGRIHIVAGEKEVAVANEGRFGRAAVIIIAKGKTISHGVKG